MIKNTYYNYGKNCVSSQLGWNDSTLKEYSSLPYNSIIMDTIADSISWCYINLLPRRKESRLSIFRRGGINGITGVQSRYEIVQ